MKMTSWLVIVFALGAIIFSKDVAGQQNSPAPQPLIVGTKEAPPLLHEDLRRSMDRLEY